MKSKNAVFGVIYSDNLFLEVWLSYYEKFFDKILIMTDEDNETLKKAREKHVFETRYFPEFLPLSRNNARSEITMPFIKSVQKELLKEYKWVLYASLDEIIVADPKKYKNIKTYIRSLGKKQIKTVFCSGYDIVEIVGIEKPIDWNKPILRQRLCWVKNPIYNKPLLTQVPLNWTNGHHSLEEVGDHAILNLNDPDLYLLHLLRIDFGACITLNRYCSRDNVPESTAWMMRDSHKFVMIPEHFKDIF